MLFIPPFRVTAFLWLLILATGAAIADTDRPAIVFILVDDMGYGDLSCTGNTLIRTPRMDQLASEGIRFTQFYVASPICSPSRVAFLTGQHPSRWGIHSFLSSRASNRKMGMPDWLDPAAPSIARAFQAAGYATAHFGKWHLGGGRDVGDAPLPQEYGFDESLVSFEGLGDRILPPGGLSEQSARLGRGEIRRVQKHEQTGIYVDRAIDFIQRHRDKPFYIHLWLNDVHDAHQPGPEEKERLKAFADRPHQQNFLAVLDAMDRQIGRLTDAIDRAGRKESTLILLTSDNGPTAWPHYYKNNPSPEAAPGSTAGFRGRKWSLYEGGIRMPLIARWPGRIPAGRVDETSLIHATDFFPTLCALAGVVPPATDFDGKDFHAALLGTPTARTTPLFWEYGRDASHLRPGLEDDRSPNLAVREGAWKLLINADGSRRELYDFSRSTDERINVADAHPDIAARLQKSVLEWRHNLPRFGPEAP